MATKDSLKQLIRLQEQDKVVDSLQASIDEIPARIQTLTQTLDADKARVAEAKNKTTRLQLAKKEKELSLGQKEEAIRKHSAELNSVKSNEAYKALLSEIDKAKADISDLETAILTSMDEIDQSAREEKAESVKLKESEARVQGEVKTLEAKKAELSAKADQEKAKREALAAGVPADMIKVYNHLHKRQKGIAMAVVKGNICGVCRIALPPQSLVEVARGAKVVTCEACQRILYSADLLAEAGAETAAAPASPAQGQ